MNRIITGTILMLALAAWTFPAQSAVILASYDFTGGSGVSIVDHPDTTAGDYDPRSTAVGGDDSAISSFSNNAYMRAENTPAGTGPNDGANMFYHSFSLTIDSGTWNIESVTYDYFATSIYQSFFTGLYTDQTGFTDTSVKLGGLDINSNAGGLATVDLTSANAIAGSAFEGLTAGSSVEFRIYFGDNSTSNDRIHRIDNLTVNGSAVIPEPGTVSLVLVAAGALFFLRKRS